MATPPTPSPTPTLPPCARGLTAADLSAYRDGIIPGGDAAALDAHVAGCPACHTRLEQLDQVGDTLRAERAPEPDERLWQAVRRAAEGDARRRPSRRRLTLISGWRDSSSAGKRTLWSGLGALAAVLLLVLGFAQLSALHSASTHDTHVPTPTATPFPTLTPLPAPTATPTATPTVALLLPHPLAWHAAVLPADPAEFNEGAIVPAGDGQTAYACAFTSSPRLLIWVTHNQGRAWTPAQVIPPAPDVNGCELVVDTSDPTVAALCWVPRGGGAGDSCTNWMTTVDGGTSWQTLPYQPFVAYDQLDSRAGVIYVLRETVGSDGSVAYHLWASRDRMHSWQQVDHGLTPDVAGFWLQPDGPGILAALSGGAYGGATQLWSSPDDGTTWHQLNVPVALPSYTPARFSDPRFPNGIVARWLLGRLDVCVSGSSAGTSGPSTTSSVSCSTDGSATWHAHELPPILAPHEGSFGANLVAITNDGTLLVADTNSLYRLAAEPDVWQSLGSLPQLAVIYCPVTGTGMLWAVRAGGADLDPQHRVFTAAYTP